MKPRRCRRPDGRLAVDSRLATVSAWRDAARPRRRGGGRALASTLGRALALPLAMLSASAPLRAQDDVATEGAIFLLLPVGGRAVGRGQAVVASVDGSEAVWWNPAGLARQEKRELAIHHYNPFFETSANALTIVVPSSLLGVLAVSANILDFGNGEQTDPMGNPVGIVTTRSFVYAASYATTAGSRLNAGVTYKLLQFQVNCSAGCASGDGANATTSAIDLGAQYDLRGFVPLAVGAAVRNLGPSLQVNDNAQRDQLPARVQLGFRWRMTQFERRLTETELSASADAIDRLTERAPSYRAGIDATWRKRASLRAGYVFDGRDASGAAIGFGIRQGGLLVDIGHQFGGIVAKTDADPVYITLRYQF
jgi:hypothetical protein